MPFSKRASRLFESQNAKPPVSSSADPAVPPRALPVVTTRAEPSPKRVNYQKVNAATVETAPRSQVREVAFALGEAIDACTQASKSVEEMKSATGLGWLTDADPNPLLVHALNQHLAGWRATRVKLKLLEKHLRLYHLQHPFREIDCMSINSLSEIMKRAKDVIALTKWRPDGWQVKKMVEQRLSYHYMMLLRSTEPFSMINESWTGCINCTTSTLGSPVTL